MACKIHVSRATMGFEVLMVTGFEDAMDYRGQRLATRLQEFKGKTSMTMGSDVSMCDGATDLDGQKIH